jgi:hypothetical protein
LLVVIGVREDGQKVLLALKNMGGESTETWRAVLDATSAVTPNSNISSDGTVCEERP